MFWAVSCKILTYYGCVPCPAILQNDRNIGESLMLERLRLPNHTICVSIQDSFPLLEGNDHNKRFIWGLLDVSEILVFM